MIKIAVFASGSGTNAENIAHYFSKSGLVRVELVLTNNEKAGVIGRAAKLDIPYEVLSRSKFEDPDYLCVLLEKRGIQFIVLAGFLLLIPAKVIEAYKGRIINIHPALLPLHGGKGFYGENVHRSVLASGAIMSGITIHQVNEKFDEGEIVFQAACHVSSDETAESLAGKIHNLEYDYYPVVIEKVIRNHFYPKPEIS